MKARPRTVAIALLLILVFGLIGMIIRSILGRADSRMLAVHVQKIEDGDGACRYRWTFESGRRWDSYGAGVRGGEHFVVLDQPGIRDPDLVRTLKGLMQVGSNQFAYEVEAHRSPTGTAPKSRGVEVERMLRGNAGGSPRFTAKGTIQVPEGPWASQFHVVQDRDASIPLPAKVRLGVIGGIDEVIEFR